MKGRFPPTSKKPDEKGGDRKFKKLSSTNVQKKSSQKLDGGLLSSQSAGKVEDSRITMEGDRLMSKEEGGDEERYQTIKVLV